MAKVDAVILAAGLSRRMGARNKLLLDINGTPMIAQVVGSYLRVITGKIHVVTGFEQDRVKAALRALPIQIIHNQRFAEGQQTSVVAGLSQVAEGATTILGLGDQPALTSDELEWLMARHAASPDKITFPVDPNGMRGNPIVIPSALRGQMLARRTSPGCRRFTRENPHLVQMVETSASGFFADIDTPDDYARLGPPQKIAVGGPS